MALDHCALELSLPKLSHPQTGRLAVSETSYAQQIFNAPVLWQWRPAPIPSPTVPAFPGQQKTRYAVGQHIQSQSRVGVIPQPQGQHGQAEMAMLASAELFHSCVGQAGVLGTKAWCYRQLCTARIKQDPRWQWELELLSHHLLDQVPLCALGGSLEHLWVLKLDGPGFPCC